jgi:A/G-specific adenine glycosylase
VTASGAAGVAALLTWGERTRRDLPWRRTRDAWAVLVSETMLQQTQVSRVAPRFEAWMARWPTPAALAAAPTGDVIDAWAGLGYNGRAVRLQACADAVVARHGGRVPDGLEQLLALPGVGPYTARAVLAFAHDRSVGVLDTNAARVLARAFAGRRLAAGEAQRLADQLVPAAGGWAWNSTVLDLGATICTARRPACGACPLRTAGCAWQRAGGPDPAIGTAGASGRQAAFAGSDRQGRGRLVAAMRVAPVTPSGLPAAAGWPEDPARAARVAAGLVRDGLATVDPDGTHRLPD